MDHEYPSVCYSFVLTFRALEFKASFRSELYIQGGKRAIVHPQTQKRWLRFVAGELLHVHMLTYHISVIMTVG